MSRRDIHMSNGLYIFTADIFVIVGPIIVDLVKTFQVVTGCNTIDEILPTFHLPNTIRLTGVKKHQIDSTGRIRVSITENESTSDPINNHFPIIEVCNIFFC